MCFPTTWIRVDLFLGGISQGSNFPGLPPGVVGNYLSVVIMPGSGLVIDRASEFSCRTAETMPERVLVTETRLR